MDNNDHTGGDPLLSLLILEGKFVFKNTRNLPITHYQ